MEKITEKELVERYANSAQKEQYEKRGSLVGDNKRGVLKRAEKCCVVTPLEHKMYKLTAIKKSSLNDKCNTKIVNGVYAYWCPVVYFALNKNENTTNWKKIAVKGGVLKDEFFRLSQNSQILSSVLDVGIKEIYYFFNRIRKYVNYYISSSIDFLSRDGILTYSINPIEKNQCGCDIYNVSVKQDFYDNFDLEKARRRILKDIKQNVLDSFSEKFKDLFDYLVFQRQNTNVLKLTQDINKLICIIPLCNYDCDNCDKILKSSSSDTESNLTNRNSPEYIKWRDTVLKRDKYKCQCCGFNQNLQAHHIENFADNPSLRVDVSNGITLCEGCHSIQSMGSFHNIFGTRHNTREQLELYLSKYGKIRKAIQDILNED